MQNMKEEIVEAASGPNRKRKEDGPLSAGSLLKNHQHPRKDRKQCEKNAFRDDPPF